MVIEPKCEHRLVIWSVDGCLLYQGGVFYICFAYVCFAVHDSSVIAQALGLVKGAKAQGRLLPQLTLCPRAPAERPPITHIVERIDH